MPEDFEKTSVGWQVQQLQQQMGEWLELTFSNSPAPNFSLPPWLTRITVWLFLGLCVSWLIWWLIRHIKPYLNFWRLQAKSLAESTQPQTELTVANWLQQSQALQRQGNYREACRALYMAMLQRLNDTKVVPHQASRTDGEYLQLVRKLPQPRPYQVLIATHEQLYFGNVPMTLSTLRRCQEAYREIEAL